MERKIYEAQVKQFTGEGRGVAVLARLGVKDRDNDVLVRGLLGGEQQAPLIQSHDWQVPPFGRAVVRERADELVADFALNLETARGREWASVLKWDLERGPLQQWSWGFTVPPGGAEPGTHEGERVRFLKRIQLLEVSPVVVGASVGSRTVALKGDSPQDQATFAAMHERVRAMTLSPLVRPAPGIRYKFLPPQPHDPRRAVALDALAQAAEALGLPSLLKHLVSEVKFFTDEGERPDFRWERKLAGATFPGGVIGLHRDLSPGEMAATAGHEFLHLVRPGATEEECDAFGRRIAAKMMLADAPRPSGWMLDHFLALDRAVRSGVPLPL